MAGAAVMIVMMGYGEATARYGIVPADGMSGMLDHHAMTTAAPVTTGATFDPSPNVAILMTVFFAAAAVIFIILLLRLLVTKTVRPNAAAPRLFVHAEHIVEALGVTVMALMFATMTG